MSDHKETHYRSVIKAISWRVFATLATILIVFAFTHKIALSLGIGVVEMTVKLILYYFHERIWSLIPLGKKKHPLSSLPIDKELKPEDLDLIKQKLKELGYIS
jgi:adenylylsulfate kinase